MNIRWRMLVGSFLSLLLLLAGRATAQQPAGQLVIASVDESTAPTILLRAYGMDSQGNPLVLSPQTVEIRHGGNPVSSVNTAGTFQAGTFTIFVIDAPPGVEPQLEQVQQAIETYASPANMVEGVDYLALYLIGENEASQLLAPTNFYNAVRNFFADPLAVQTGPTALVDSVGDLLQQVETLMPKPDIYTSLVIFTDGTDVVSSDFDAEEIGPLAAELGIPAHTVWLENENLQPFSQQAGQDYLAALAAESRGVAAQLDQETEVQVLWDRIGAFREHTVLEYVPEDLSGGEQQVTLGLRDEPTLEATAAVRVPATAPSVSLDLPEDSRDLSLESLDEPVSLAFSASVGWLDGQDREITSAQLLVNGQAVQEIAVERLERFTAEIASFSYGPNTIQVQVSDELGQQATSPPVTLTVLQGQTEVPEAIQAGGLLDSLLGRLVLACLGALALLGLLALAVYLLRRRRKDDLPPPETELLGPEPLPRRGLDAEMTYVGSLPGDQEPEVRQATADDYEQLAAAPYLEILRSVTRMPPLVELGAVEHRLGRSPVHNDIVLENDITVSRVHASIVREGEHYRIYDESSTSGTLVNDRPVPDYGHQLRDGDEIRLGDVLIRYRQ